MAKKTPCGCGNSPVAIPDAVLEAQPHSAVVASYGLCLAYDEYVSNRCVWVVELKDGTKIFQDDDRPGLITGSAWKRLGHYIQDYPQNGIAKMRLRLGSHIVELPSDQPFYFYSWGLLQAITQTHKLDFHIVGWPDDDGNIQCTWYKVPELVVSQTATRAIEDCVREQLIGDVLMKA